MLRPRSRTWGGLPAGVRSALEEVLGGVVVAWESCAGGFSVGTADVVTLADGRRAFVKCADPAEAPVSAGLHRAEAAVLSALPPLPGVPRLVGHLQRPDAVALVVDHVDGRRVGAPWSADDLEAASSALDDLVAAATPCPAPALPPAERHYADDVAGWARLAATPAPDLDPWAAQHLPRLVALGARAPAALAGDTLVHGDVRGDNLLRGPGGVTVVDWPHACRGAAWFDALSLRLSGSVEGGLDPEAGVHRSAVLAAVPPDDVTAVLAGLTGYFLDAARHPEPPDLHGLRAFQRRQGVAALAWLRRRTPHLG